MENTQIKSKISRLKLSGMLDMYEHRMERAIEEKWSYSTLLDMLLTDALERKDHKQLTLRIAKSGLDVTKTLETFDFTRKDLVSPTILIKELCTCRFIEKNQNIFIFGCGGLGKSHIAQAIGHQACRRGYSVLFRCTKGLMDWIYAGIGDGSRKKRLDYVVKTQLLILDDYGLQELNEEQQKDLYYIVSERYEKKSIVLTTNRAIEEWPDIFTHPLIGNAAVDRLIHRGIEVVLEGPSHRLAEYIKTRESLLKLESSSKL